MTQARSYRLFSMYPTANYFKLCPTLELPTLTISILPAGWKWPKLDLIDFFLCIQLPAASNCAQHSKSKPNYIDIACRVEMTKVLPYRRFLCIKLLQTVPYTRTANPNDIDIVRRVEMTQARSYRLFSMYPTANCFKLCPTLELPTLTISILPAGWKWPKLDLIDFFMYPTDNCFKLCLTLELPTLTIAKWEMPHLAILTPSILRTLKYPGLLSFFFTLGLTANWSKHDSRMSNTLNWHPLLLLNIRCWISEQKPIILSLFNHLVVKTLNISHLATFLSPSATNNQLLLTLS